MIRFVVKITVVLCALFASVLANETLAVPSTAPSASTAPTSQPSIVAEIPLGEFDEPITIPVRWMNRDECFVLDTGATGTILDETAFTQLERRGHTLEVNTAGGPRSFPTFEPPELKVGPFQLHECGTVITSDLAPFRIMSGIPVIGIIGISALKQYVVQIDFDNRRLRLLRPDGAPHPEWGSVVPIESGEKGEWPLIAVQINGRKEMFMIDSGDISAGSFRTDLFERLSAATTRRVISAPSATAGGWSESRVFRVPQLKVGNTEYHDLVFGETKSPYSLLGNDFLYRNLTTLDLPGRRLYLKPGKKVSYHYDEMSGMSLMRVAGETRATQLIDKGPAFEAGIREQDALLEVDGQSTEGLSLSQLRRILRSGEGRLVKVKYRHDDEIRETEIKLRPQRL